LTFTEATVRFLETKADGYFVKTMIYNKASEVLSEGNLVVLTGHPGEGKTAMAVHLALDGGVKPENCIKLECSRDWEEVNWSLRCFTTVIIDDIFGGVSLDHGRLTDWKRVLNDIEQRALDKELRVIITSRHYIIEEASEDMDKITMFKQTAKSSVHLDSRNLSEDEMKQILKAILNRNAIEEDVDMNDCVNKARCVSNPPSGEKEERVFGFPECCALFATETLISHGPDFFKRPEHHFKTYIEQLYKSKDIHQVHKFIALVAVWAQEDQKINESDLKNPKNVSAHIQNIADCFGIEIDHTLVETIKCSLRAYSTYLLMYDNSSCEYVYSHNLIGEMVGVVLGKHKPRECIQLCPRAFLKERITLNDDIGGEMKVSIPPGMYTDLCQKFIDTVCREGNSVCMNHYYYSMDVDILKHNAFESKTFVQVFLQYILDNNYATSLFNVSLLSSPSVLSECKTHFLLDYILAKDRLVLAEHIIPNISLFLTPDTYVSGDSICNVMRKLPTLLKSLFESGRASPNETCFGTNSNGNPSYSHPLIVGSSENLIDSVRCLLQHGADSNVTNTDGETALHCAARDGHREIFMELLSNGADVNLVDNNHNSALHLAARKGQHAILSELVKVYMNVNYANKLGMTALHEAAAGGLCDVIEAFLNSNADINAKNRYGDTPLHRAAREGRKDALKTLLKNGADVNIVNHETWTVLHCAANEGYCDIIEELMSSNACVNAANSCGNTPLHLAAQGSYKDAVITLLNNGANVNIANRDKWTALHYASYGGHCGVIKELLQNKADVNAKTSHGYTPFDLILNNEHIDAFHTLFLKSDTRVSGDSICIVMRKLPSLMKSLLESGRANPNETCSDTKSKGYPCYSHPLIVGSSENLIDSVMCLLQHGADPNVTNTSGETALHCAARDGHREIFMELLRNGADVNLVDNNHNSVLHLAAGKGQHAILSELVKIYMNVNYANKFGMTALHEAAAGGHCDVIEALLHSKAFVDSKNSNDNTPLHIAAKYGYTSVVERLLENGADVDIVNRNYWTALHFASYGGHCDVIQKLLQNKADVNAKDLDGNAPLHLTARKGHNDAVKVLLTYKGADVNIMNQTNWTALHYAADGGHCYVIEKILNCKVDVNIKTICGNTPLHLAVVKGYRSVVNRLLNAGADVHIKTNCGYTPLHLAVSKGYTNVVNRLLIAGADFHITTNNPFLHDTVDGEYRDIIEALLNSQANVNATDRYGNTPLHRAALKGCYCAVKILLCKGADTNIMNKNNWTALHNAADGGHCDVMGELFNNRADVNSKNSDGSTPLHRATLKGYKDAVNVLLNNGADVSIVDDDNRTALYYAEARGTCDEIEGLLISKVDFNTKDNVGSTPLHWAASKGYTNAVKTLLRNGANINIVDEDNWTALHYAAESGHCDTIEELLNSKADINAQDVDGNTPLQMATSKGYKNAVTTLLQNGACVNIVKNDNWTALHFAVENGHFDVIEELLKSNADVNAKTSMGNSSLHRAAYKGYKDAVQILLKNGADVNMVNKDNKTALHEASEGGHFDVMEELLNNADVNVKGRDERTPLQRCCECAIQ